MVQARYRLIMQVLKSHVFWFVALGALIFVIDERLSDPLDTIVVDAALERNVAALWSAQAQREPTAAELASLVQDWITEEIWLRESMRLNLSEGDEIIRRRMIQKMQFIAEQEAAITPTDEALRAYYQANQSRYELPSTISFEQLQFQSRDLAITASSAGASPETMAQATMLSRVNVRQSLREIASTFGPDFTRSLETLEVAESWQGPVQSSFGWHLVKVLELNPPVLAPFEDIRTELGVDYDYDARRQAQADFIDQVRPNYEIIRQAD